MTKIDFYVLQQEAAIVRLHYVCRLTEKALHHGHQVAIAVEDKSQAIALSDYLWSFKPESFLPHQLQNSEPQAPIVIVWNKSLDDYHDILINLKQNIPDGFSHFQRVIEVVIQEEECLKLTRSHFQFYRERGYPLKSHNIDG